MVRAAAPGRERDGRGDGAWLVSRIGGRVVGAGAACQQEGGHRGQGDCDVELHGVSLLGTLLPRDFMPTRRDSSFYRETRRPRRRVPLDAPVLFLYRQPCCHVAGLVAPCRLAPSRSVASTSITAAPTP